MLLFPLIFAVSCFAAVCGVLLASLLVDRFRTITKYAYNSRHNVTIGIIILFFAKTTLSKSTLSQYDYPGGYCGTGVGGSGVWF